MLFSVTTYAQRDYDGERQPDVFSAGLGLGFDYGGIGGQVIAYPQKNIGLFFGGGYVIAGFGYNAGIKLRLPGAVVDPFILGMYGYNAAIYVSDNTQFNKIFYGPSFAAGIDLHKRTASRGYWSFGITVPVRSSKVKAYMDDLKENYGVSLSDLFPVGFTIGYKFTIF